MHAFLLPHLNALADLGKLFAQHCSAPFVLYLNGNLGAGKTTLAQFFIHALGFQGKVKSPTYSLVEVYPFSRLYLYHFDFYRFRSPFEFEEAGLIEYFNEHSICLVEWPEKATGWVPAADITCTLHTEGVAENARRVELSAYTAKGQACLKKMLPSLAVYS